jgi:hypothetical protein
MFDSGGRLGLVALLLVTLGAAAPCPALEPVSLSRHIFRVDAPPAGTTISSLDSGILDSLCRDDDGCSLSVRSQTTVGIRASEWRFYLSDTNSWSTSASNTLKSDDDDLAEFAGELDGNGATCVVTDGESMSADIGLGFWIIVETTALPATCLVVLGD